MQYRLKNVEKSGASKLSALEIATQFENTISQKFGNVKLLRIDINEQQESIITSVYENKDPNNMYNKFLDVQFIKEILQVEELEQDEEDDDYEDFDNGVVLDYKYQQLKQAIDCFFEFSKDLDQVKQMQLENKFKSIIGNTTNKEQKLQIKLLIQCKGNQVLYLHQEKLFFTNFDKDPAYIDLISMNPFVNPDVSNMMNSTLIKVASFQLGMLQFIQEQQQLQLQQFFTSAQFQKQMNMPYQIYIKENKGNEKCLQLIIGFMHQFSIRLDIDLTLCQTVYQQGQLCYYFRMLSPPSCHAMYHGRYKYENNQIKSQFVKVDNIFLNNLVQSEKINEIQRLLFLNNTTILIKLDQNCEYLKQKISSFHNINVIDYPIAHIKLQNDISYFRLMNSKYLNFSLRFNILSAISQNKFNIQKHIQDLIETCEAGSKKLSEKSTQIMNGIFEYTFNTFCKITSNLSLVNDKDMDRKNESHLKYFKSVLKRTYQDFIELNDPTMRLAYTRRVSMTPSGILYFNKQPEVTSGILRQHYNIVEYFLRVHYEDENQDIVLNIPYITQSYYYNFMFPSLKILGQNYELFTWSSSSLRQGTCWFVDFNGAGKQRFEIIRSIGNFTNLKYDEIAKNAARLGQNLSTSISVELVGPINIIIKDDLLDKNKKLYTDGIGKISQDLIDQIRQKIKVNQKIKISAVQIRYEGAKGLLVLDENLEQKTIVLRRSMIKYNPAKGGYPNKIQILDFNKFRGGYLNRQIIILLLTLKVKDNVFQELQDEYLKRIEELQMKDASIYKYFSVDYCDEQIDVPNIMDALRAYINIGMDDNILCQGILAKLKQRGLLQLRKKTTILVDKAARVLGVIDEHKLLQPNEIYCLVQDENNVDQVEPENIQGEVLVTRNPCLHPGDIKKLNALSTQEILKRNNGKNPYGQLINCLIFPASGNSLPCQIAGGDLDGDLYFICWDNRLLPPELVKSMVYDNMKQNQVQYKKIDFRENNQKFHENVDKNFDMKSMFDFLYLYLNSETLGLIDNSHLAWADKSNKIANDPNCLELAELHSDAVDFVKTGKQVNLDTKLLSKIFPDYMEKEKQITYESQTIIGKLYRQVLQMGIQQDQQMVYGLGFNQNGLPKIEYKLLYNFDKLINECKQIKQNCKITINLEDKKDQNEQQQENNDELINEEIIQLIQKYIDDNFKRHYESSIKLIMQIFEQIVGITQIFSVKSEFEIYSGNFSSMQKGDGLYQKKKLNVEKYQKRIIALIIQLHQEVDRKLQTLSEIERLQRISLINFILTYSPNSHPYPTFTILGEFISQLMKQITSQEIWKMLFNIHQIWYRGVGQYLFWKDLLKIYKNDQDELI
ncbi:unnamed protein product [Paramecium pentaurelia]|uniref:RNA-dependent RNA polymerase n=1 Tax=Paramecium pentaurelia TaxID=43138 RepID=A0A8S1UMY3_9CILI|nr:unnamed protein product [Paramecium pentaurelia]